MNPRLAHAIASVCLLGIFAAAGWRQALAAVTGVALGWALITGRRLRRS